MADLDTAAPAGPWRIACAVPEWRPLQEAARGAPADAAYLLLNDIAAGLVGRGHRLTYIGQRALGDDVCARHLEDVSPAHRTWSDSRWFSALSRTAWRLQRLLGVPYLNVFSNYRLYDVCLQCLPGHDLVYERNGLYRMGVAKACRTLGLPYVLFVDADEILEYDYLGTPLTGWLRWRARR
ncbi:MAG TPA: hypothetical protein VMW48_09850, partial [Vicinamibacterales bacterium]|nr:hypothetical protein [Vicinamibacterales bacterium]